MSLYRLTRAASLLGVAFALAPVAVAAAPIAAGSASAGSDNRFDLKPVTLASLQTGDGGEPDAQLVAQEVPEVSPAASQTVDPYQRKDGPYLQITWDPIVSRDDAWDKQAGKGTFSNGTAGSIALGYQLNAFRGEFEYTGFQNKFDKLYFNASPDSTSSGPFFPATSPGGGRVTGRTLMFNLYFDIPVSKRFVPYVGGGLGTYNATISGLAPAAFLGNTARGYSADRFIYQLKAGLAYKVAPQLSVFAGWRYMQGNQFSYDMTFSGGPAFPPLNITPNGLKTNALELGFRLCLHAC